MSAFRLRSYPPAMRHHFVTAAPVRRAKHPERYSWDTERGCLVHAKSGKPVGTARFK